MFFVFFKEICVAGTQLGTNCPAEMTVPVAIPLLYFSEEL